MSDTFKYDTRRNCFKLKIITQIDIIDRDNVIELEKLLLIPKGSINISEVPQHILNKYGLKVLIAYEDVPAPDAYK